jgi:DNA polymerase I-like protein with 3'-5' exonuclease and polymerase domains
VRLVTDPTGPELLDPQERYWLYAGNDTVGTRQVFDVLWPQIAGQDRVLYDCAMAFQAPCLAMTLRGVRVDEPTRRETIARCEREEQEAIQALNASAALQEVWDVRGKRPPGATCPEREGGARHVWGPRGVEPDAQVCNHCAGPRLVGQGFNPHSPVQCAALLYEKLGLKVRYSRKRSADGTRRPTTDDEALEALATKYPEHAALIDLILAARGLRKQLGALRTRLDDDGRWRASFNVCAAETGRMSSSGSPYRTGANLQNIADKNRGIFVADPGLELWYADLEQAESRIVAYTSECPQDIDDHNAGDTHTNLARTLFPHLAWGTDSDRAIADGFPPWDPDHEYRHYAKIVRHGTNIGMSGNGVARQLHIPAAQGKALREAYFARYPENAARQVELRRAIRDTGVLVGPLGNTRRFLGRLWEDDVQREGLAQIQQSTVAWMLNLAMWRIWYEMDGRLSVASPPRPSDPCRVWVLGQIHDAILGLRRPGDDDAMRRVVEIMQCPVLINGEPVVIGAEVQVGRSWTHGDLRKLKL